MLKRAVYSILLRLFLKHHWNFLCTLQSVPREAPGSLLPESLTQQSPGFTIRVRRAVPGSTWHVVGTSMCSCCLLWVWPDSVPPLRTLRNENLFHLELFNNTKFSVLHKGSDQWLLTPTLVMLIALFDALLNSFQS